MMTRNPLDRAIQASFDGSLTEAERLELRAVLKSDPAARALYYEYADLHQSLIFRISRFTSFDSARSVADMRRHLQSRRTARLAITAAAAALVLLGVILKMTLIPPPALASHRTTPGTLISIHHGSGKARENGELGENSIVHLRQGSLEFTQRNGIRGIVLAPARFELRSEKEMHLHHGTAWFRVGPEGKGFRVITPEFTVTDLGTEFGILAGGVRGEEVHVFTGRVQARAPGGTPITLTAHKALRLGPDGRFQPMPAKPGHFLTRLPQESPTSLIVNGGFESGTPPDDENFGVKATAAALPGWHFGRDVTVALRSANGRPGFGSGWSNLLSPTGDKQVSFNNTNPRYEVGTQDDSLWQSFATVPGHDYEVTFSMGGYFGDKGDVSVTAAIHDGIAITSPPMAQTTARRIGKANRDNGFNPPVTFTFTARSTRSTLVFTETSANSGISAPTLDNIAVRLVRGE